MKKAFGGSSVRRIHSVGGAFVPARAEQAAPDGRPALAQFLDEARSTGLPMCWKGQDQVFDGARCLQGSAEDSGAPAGQQPGYAAGSLQYDGGHEPDHFPREVRRAEGAGRFLANAPSVDQQRVQFPGGMQANLADTRASGSWHICVRVDASQPALRKAKRSPASTERRYAVSDYASWFNANETVNGLKFLSIGSVEGRPAGRGGFVGRIAAVALIPARSASSRRRSYWGTRGQAPAARFTPQEKYRR